MDLKQAHNTRARFTQAETSAGSVLIWRSAAVPRGPAAALRQSKGAVKSYVRVPAERCGWSFRHSRAPQIKTLPIRWLIRLEFRLLGGIGERVQLTTPPGRIEKS